MGMFSGSVSPSDYKKLKTGMGGAKVDAGDYEVVATGEMRHFEPRDGKLGAYIPKFQITPNNENEEFHGDVLEARLQYDPSPATAGRETMNNITLQNMAQLIEATGIEPVNGNDGNVDLIKSIQAVLASEPVLMVTVSHSEDGKYQDVGNFRPAV